MDKIPRSNASMRWFLEDLTYRIVAKTGIPSDRHHIGKIILQSLTEDPNFILQIDGSTGVKETSGSVLRRSIQCAVALKKIGLHRGDVISLMVPNHSDTCIVYYAASFIGAAIAPIDIYSGPKEIQGLLDIQKPTIVFCLNKYIKDMDEAVHNAKLTPKIISFDSNKEYTDFTTFLNVEETEVKIFKPTDFDPNTTTAFLLMTSGTSGVPKCAALSHASFLHGSAEVWSRQTKFPDHERMAFILSPLQWLSSTFHYILSAVLRYTRLQSPLPLDQPHVCDMINKFKPTHMISSPPFLISLLNSNDVKNCDLSCFQFIMIGGSAAASVIIETAKKMMPKVDIIVQYGQTEMSGLILQIDNHPPGSIGKLHQNLQFRLINAVTQEDIVEPNQTGELWLKGPAMFMGYYNDPERTKEVLTDDGWLKTGDLVYLDEYSNLYFVDRMKMLLKYKNHHVSPIELENVIHGHPAVQNVTVTGIDDLESGDLPVACVVRKPGHEVTEEEIKDLVKNSLADTKQLRGGVIFMEELPVTATSKIDRIKLKKIVAELIKND